MGIHIESFWRGQRQVTFLVPLGRPRAGPNRPSCSRFLDNSDHVTTLVYVVGAVTVPFASEAGVLVDLNAVVLKGSIRSPLAAIARTANEDETSHWYVPGSTGELGRVTVLPADVEVSLLVRTSEPNEPAWHRLLRDEWHVDDVALSPAGSAGAILFIQTAGEHGPHIVAWCFGQGSRWIRRNAVSPRFGVLVALNAMAESVTVGEASDVGVKGVSLATREGNLRQASLVAAVPGPAGSISRIDTLTDLLTAVRVHTGNAELGRVNAGRSLHFKAVVGSVPRLRELSALVVRMATQEGYRAVHGWIDYTVPEEDDGIANRVLDCVWSGVDDAGRPVPVEVAWWEDAEQAAGTECPVTHWRLFGERRGRLPSQQVSLTWSGIKGQVGYAMSGDVSGHEALLTEVRFFCSHEEEQGRCRLLDLVTAELAVANRSYVVADGDVWRVDVSFLSALNDELAHHVVPSHLVPYQPGELERAYNTRAASALGMLLLDKSDVRPTGETQVEPCDLIGLDGTLYHVKRHTNAPGISHLANQAVASATVLLRDQTSRDKLCQLISHGAWAQSEKEAAQQKVEETRANRLPVVLAIVGEWTKPTVKSLSLLCRLALKAAIQRLEDLGYAPVLMLIEPATGSPRHSK